MQKEEPANLRSNRQPNVFCLVPSALNPKPSFHFIFTLSPFTISDVMFSVESLYKK